MAAISLKGVIKRYPNGYEAIKGVDLDVAEGEFVVLVGPSGCGKTTLLRMVAGLEEVTSGDIVIGGERMNNVAPMNRDIAMVFQNYALYPHMSVANNIGFALKVQKVPKAEARRRVEAAAGLLGLSDLLDQKPGQLSGGQRQRVAMGRAMVREPVAFLMDEPLSNLDARLRVQMRAEISRLQRHLGVATLYVTHDQTEAMTMGDRVAVLRDGTVRQFDTPQRLYERPADSFVAGFIGSPSMNLYRVALGTDARSVTVGSQVVDLGPAVLAARPGLARYAGRDVVIGLRPEHLRVGRLAGEPGFAADATLVEQLGSETLVHFVVEAAVASPGAGEAGDPAALAVEGEGVARLDATPGLKVGDRLHLSLPGERVHVFDPDTQLSVWE
jgi:multiple sugar transport system ATP-binding protein